MTGISFVDKAEELKYKGDVAEMYMYEAEYYFMQAKMQMEQMDALSPEKDEDQNEFIKEVGYDTIKSTCKVFDAGLKKLKEHISSETEKEKIGGIIEAISPYL